MSNDLTNLNNLTMSSREIAERTGKRHRNVTRDIELMMSQMGGDALKFEHIYSDSRNRQQTEYILPKNLCLTLVSGYSARLRNAIIERWLELEGRPTERVIADQSGPLRKASIAARNTLAELWQTRGRFAPADYGRTTNRMKSVLGIDQAIKKHEMTGMELAHTMIAEEAAKNNIEAFDIFGKQAVEAASVDAARKVDELVNGPKRAKQIQDLRGLLK
jgi:phage regulator Rha-like protein